MPPERLAHEQGERLNRFSVACRSAIRAASLYPARHPAVSTSIARLAAVGHDLADGRAVTIEVGPQHLTIDGRAVERPDPAVEELRSILHRRLVSRLTLGGAVNEEGWPAVVALLSRSPEDLLAEGGIARAWKSTSRSDIEIWEFDYADVLRERGTGGEAIWDRLIARCLRQDAGVDWQQESALLDAARDPGSLSLFVERLQESAKSDGVSVRVWVPRVLQLLQAAYEAGAAIDAGTGERILTAMISSCAALTPDAMLTLLDERRTANTATSRMATTIASRIERDTVVSFVTQSLRSGQSMERLALALCVLLPASERPWALEVVRAEARDLHRPPDADLDQVWHAANDFVRSYSDEGIVSPEYGRELTSAARQVMELERIADDPPQRINDWLASVLPPVLEALDLVLLADLLRLQDDEQWESIGELVAREVERRTAAGDASTAQTLLDTLMHAAVDRQALAAPWGRLVERLVTGPLVDAVAGHLRTADDEGAARYARLLQCLGEGVVRPVTGTLARQTDERVIRRLGVLLLSFGAAGRRAVEQLRTSTSPAARRTAVRLLRASGPEAWSELSSMLSDPDPAVRTESLHAIVELGTRSARQVLLQSLNGTGTSAEAIVLEMIAMHDHRTGPLFCYMLAKSVPRRGLVEAHCLMLEALGTQGEDAEVMRVLQQALHRGEWWAPRRTKALRTAAATALRRLGTPAAMNVLESAARTGRPGVRRVAARQLATGTRARS